jgi:uncharacterized SAM-binding protein YcdF (DUF218 family)
MLFEFLLPSPLHLVVVLIVATWFALRSAPDRPLWRWRHALLICAAWAWVGSMPGLANWFTVLIEGPLPASDCDSTVGAGTAPLLVVPASGQLWGPDGSVRAWLDPNGMNRVLHAVKIWRQAGGRFVFLGGPGAGEEDSLAGAMKRQAILFGVPAASIQTSGRSTNTYQDLLFAREPIAAYRGPVLLVTSALHMPRAQAVAGKLGLRMVSCRTDFTQIPAVGPDKASAWQHALTFLPDSDGPPQMGSVLREIAGRIAYRWRGWSD